MLPEAAADHSKYVNVLPDRRQCGVRTSRSGVSSSRCSFPGYSSSASACMHAQLESVWSCMHPAGEATPLHGTGGACIVRDLACALP